MVGAALDYWVLACGGTLLTSLDHEGATSALFGAPPPRAPPAGPAQHPLLSDPIEQSTGPGRSPRGIAGIASEFIAGLEGRGGPQAMQLLETLLARHGQDGRETISINIAESGNAIDLSIGGRSFAMTSPNQPVSSSEESPAIDYTPKPTMQRWLEEMSLMPGSSDQTTRLVNHVINRLMPEAKQRAEADAERTKRAEEDAAGEVEKAQAEETASAASVALPQSPVTAIPVLPPQDVEMGRALKRELQYVLTF